MKGREIKTSDGGSNFADLHVHTVYSDGIFSPREVVETANQLGLGAIAITDHDCVDGIAPTIEEAVGTGLEVIPGVEISSMVMDKEIHLLGYFIDWNEQNLSEKLRAMKEARRGRMSEMIRLLKNKGIELDERMISGMVHKGTVGRLHLAKMMRDAGFVKTTREAFDKYIGNGKPCHVKHEHLGHAKAIGMILDAGGVPVLGHPGVSGVDEYIPEIIEAGILGIEVYHTEQNKADSEKYLKIVREHSLVAAGGSDCHGSKSGRVLMGTVRVGRDAVEALRAASARKRL